LNNSIFLEYDNSGENFLCMKRSSSWWITFLTCRNIRYTLVYCRILVKLHDKIWAFVKYKLKGVLKCIGVEIWTPLQWPPTDVADTVAMSHHRRGRHPGNNASQTVTDILAKDITDRHRRFENSPLKAVTETRLTTFTMSAAPSCFTF